jgi:hypothetical protein
MSSPELRLEKTMKEGKPAIRLVVRYATPELRSLLDTLGVNPDCSIANCRSIVCASLAELDAARNPIKALFGHKGEWLGKEVA